LGYRRSEGSGVTLQGGGAGPHAGRLFSLLLLVALALTLGFIVVPLLAIFLRVSPGELISQLGSEAAVDALVVTIETSLIAQLLIIGIGTPAAYFLATRAFRGRSALITLVELPIVLPPAVAGIALLVTFGRLGLLGETLDALGVSIGFTEVAVVMAVVFVAGPFYVRGAVAAFEAVDTTLLAASRTLGAGPGRTFRRIALPLARSGLAAAAAISFARGIGEFGATLFFAGSLQGVTQTLSLAIYAQLDIDFNVALALSAFLVVASAAVLFGVKFLPSWTRSISTSLSRSARSASS
jgi:molybdate transport system permease protein